MTRHGYTRYSSIFPYVLALTGAVICLVYGGIIWSDELPVLFSAILYCTLVLATAFIWLAGRKASLNYRTPFDWVLLAGIIVIITSWASSPAYRHGISRVVLLLAYIFLFYFFLTLFKAGFGTRPVFFAIFLISGVVAAVAALEVYYQYNAWFTSVGLYRVYPPYPYRILSLLGHANLYQAFLNIFAPLVVVRFYQVKSVPTKIAYGTWLAFYLITLPFSSSRGGWLAFAIGFGLLLAKLLYDRRFYVWLWKSFRKSIVITISATTVAIAGLLYATYRFWVFFSYHPSHTANLLDSRSFMWLRAIEMWRSSPLIGIGVGRFGMEYLTIGSVPPGFWATHSHNLYLHTLAETGLPGLLVILSLLASGVIWIYHCLRATALKLQWQSWAIIAAMVGFLVASLADDFSGVPAIIVPLIILVAILVSSSSATLPPAGIVATASIWSLGLLIVLWSYWSIWAAMPYNAASHAVASNPTQAALLIEDSIRRDPHNAAYYARAGYVWSEAWSVTGDSHSLDNARTSLLHSLTLEPAPSFHWANLSVLDWHAGDHTAAYNHIQHALATSPNEPSYHLILGWFHEQEGHFDLASDAYQQALALAPAWSSHPYWLDTTTRQAISSTVQYVRTQQPAPVSQSLAAVTWSGDRLAPLLLRIRQAEAAGDQDSLRTEYNSLLAQSSLFLKKYGSRSTNPLSLQFDLVPGYMILEEDTGQFDALEDAHAFYLQSGDCDQAAHTWNILHRLRAGGSLLDFTPAPPCPSNPGGTEP